MNRNILLSLFVIICTFQVIEPLQIGSECGLTEKDIKDELEQIFYVIGKSRRFTNCFTDKLQKTITKVEDDNCGRTLLHLYLRLEGISNSTDNIEGLQNCINEIYDDFNEFGELVNIEREQCANASSIVQNQVEAEITKVEENKKSLKYFIASEKASCIHNLPITWDKEVLKECLNGVLVQATAKAQDIMNYQESIPGQFEKSADDATDYFASCCDSLQAKWLEIGDPLIDKYEKCAEKLIQA